MKLKTLHIFFLTIVSFLMSSCVSTKFAEQNIQGNELSLSRKGEIIIRYNPKTMQIGYNQNMNEYRIHDDNMGQYFILTCSEMPTVKDQSLRADLQYTTADNTIHEKGLPFEVQKTDGSGKIWLWNKSKKYGIVIKQL